MNRSHRFVPALLALASAAAPGCLGAADAEDPTAANVEPVLGASRFFGSCNNDQETLIIEAERFGRRLASSSGFQQCIQRAMTGFTYTAANGSTRQIGPYIRCSGDPGNATDSAATRAANVLRAARSPNDLVQGCTPTLNGSTIASTSLNYGLGHGNDEGFQWVGPIVTTTVNELRLPACASGSTPGVCHWPYPWPYSGMAATAWHEAAHTHGYQHGDGTPASCGLAPTAAFSMTVNTVPYIIQACMEVVADDSIRANAGGVNLSNGCARGRLSIASTIRGTAMQCVDDPRLSSMALAAGTRTTASAFGVFSSDRVTGNLLRLTSLPGAAPRWAVIGGPARSFAANDEALYAVTPDGARVMRYNGSTWTQVGGGSQGLVVGGRRLFSIHPTTGDIWRYDGSPMAWTQVGGPGAQFAVTSDGRLYGLSGNRQAVMQFSEGALGSFGWTQVGGAASQIFAAGTLIHAVRPDNLAVLRNGAAGWEPVVSSSYVLRGRFIGTAGGRIYALDGQRLTQYRGASGRTVETLAEDVDSVASTGSRVLLDRATVGPFELLRP